MDTRTPVLVGGGQVTDRLGSDDYRALSVADLGAAAARCALLDTGGDPRALTAAIDTVAGVRQFEISTPRSKAPLGRADNYPRAVARRIGAQPARAVLDVSGGQSPQHLVNEFAAAIARGESEVVLLVGSEAMSTIRHLQDQEHRPDFTEEVGGQLEDRGFGLDGLTSEHLARHGLRPAAAQYALLEHARRARLGQSRADHLSSVGALLQPFSEVAASNPFAAVEVSRTAAELVTVTDSNRMIADPYPRYVVARDQVNQGAAVVMTSVAKARSLGISPDRWVYLHGHADLSERPLLERPDLGSSPAALAAVESALTTAGLDVDEISLFDLYSCFPIAVFNIVDGLKLDPRDSRPLTVTGGLPFFGGPGNNYSMHAIAEMISRLRARPRSYGLVGANGGTMSKYSVGIYSTVPASLPASTSGEVQARLGAAPRVPVDERPAGTARVETFTVNYRRGREPAGVVVARLVGGARCVARVADNVLAELVEDDPIDRQLLLQATATGNLAIGAE